MNAETGDFQGLEGRRNNIEDPTLQIQLELSDTGDRSESNADIFSAMSDEQNILAVSIGTSSIRGCVFDKFAGPKGTASAQIELLQPEPGWCEVDPHKLVQDVCHVVRESITAAGLRADHITCMGLATEGPSFLTWDRETGQPFHNIITWEDLRSVEYVRDWNRSNKLFAFNLTSKLLYLIFGKKRHMAASGLKFKSNQAALKLLWVLENIPEVRMRAAEGKVMFGCTETWLLWKLTLGKTHLTDYSCASRTGLFDAFQMEWNQKLCNMLNISLSIFPKVKDTSGDFGITDPEICGFRIPITAVVADQQSSMFGHCCFSPGDVRCTLGARTFLHINTGSVPYASLASDLYPIIGWKIGRELVYLAEGQSADTGTTLAWARSLGVVTDMAESSDVAESVPDSGGVFFVPSVSGLQAPHNDDKAATAMLGMTPSTTEAHIVRALLESVGFRFKSLYDVALAEITFTSPQVRVDGESAANTFLVQMLSDVFNQVMECSLGSDMSCLGTAFLAGIARGVWSSKEDLKRLRPGGKQVQPRPTWSKVRISYQHWQNAVHRSQSWYSTT